MTSIYECTRALMRALYEWQMILHVVYRPCAGGEYDDGTLIIEPWSAHRRGRADVPMAEALRELEALGPEKCAAKWAASALANADMPRLDRGNGLQQPTRSGGGLFW